MEKEFLAWLAANNYDNAKLTDVQRSHLHSAWKTETQPPAPPAPTTSTSVTEGFDAEMEACSRETSRIERIREITSKAAVGAVGNRQKLERFKSLCDLAIADKKCSIESFQLKMLQEDRYIGPIISVPQGPAITEDVIEAAVCLHHKLPGIESGKIFSERTLDAANKQFKHGVGLKRLLLLGARSNGFRGDDSDAFTLARYAMRASQQDAEWGMRSDAGVSTGVQVPGILSNTANKFIAPSFMYTEQSWRQISKISPVSDFKTKTTYRMTGANTYKKVSPGGEIKHGSMSELSYTDAAETYGILLGISRNDLINDDLGAFVTASQEIGRGAGDVLNNVFWAVWLDDSAFFPTDKSYANYDDGATDSVLSLAGLDNANSIFNLQTKPDGTPLGIAATILLVPTALEATAKTLMMSTFTNVATSSVALTGNNNIWQSMFKPVASRYLSRTTLPDGNGVSQTVTGSSTAWYLLADPANVAAISVVFLFGKEMPTVESSDFEFDRLGIATRAFFDFGVNKHEYRAGAKLKGAA